MTVGEKIRNYRILRGLTQKQLGEKALKGKLNSGVRINQYEKDMAVPGEDIRQKLATALEVDMEALSDVDITSDEDFMYVLFELEETKGLQLYKENGKIHMVFDDTDSSKSNEQLITYLNFWYVEYMKNKEDVEDYLDYMKWKGQFKSKVSGYLAEKEELINKTYQKRKEKAKKEIPYAKETPDIIWLLRKIIDSGLTLTTTYSEEGKDGYTFRVSELLNSPSDEAAGLFAQFLSEIEHFNKMGAHCYGDVYFEGDSLVITYYIPVPALCVIRSAIEKYLKFKKIDSALGDIVAENFEREFNYDLKQYKLNLKEEIEHWAAINGTK